MGDFSSHRFGHGGFTAVVRRYGPGEHVSPDARAYLLVHGIGVSSRYFAPLSAELRRHGTVYAVDLPGFGSAQPKPARAPTIEDLAALLVAFTSARGLRNPVLVGHSMGTQVVTEMAIHDPSVSDCLVLIGPVVDPRAPTAAGQAFRLIWDILAEPLRSNVVVLRDYLRCGPRWYLAELPAMLGYPLEDRLRLVTAATLVMRGAKDPVAPTRWVARLAQVLRRPSTVEIPKGPHVVQFTAAPQVAAAILAHAQASVPDPERRPEQ